MFCEDLEGRTESFVSSLRRNTIGPENHFQFDRMTKINFVCRLLDIIEFQDQSVTTILHKMKFHMMAMKSFLFERENVIYLWYSMKRFDSDQEFEKSAT